VLQSLRLAPDAEIPKEIKKGRKGGALERRELTVVATAEMDCYSVVIQKRAWEKSMAISSKPTREPLPHNERRS